MGGYKVGFCKKKTNRKNQHSAVRELAWQQDEEEEEATKHRKEKTDKHICNLKLFLHKEPILCTNYCICNGVYVHEICESLVIVYSGRNL